MLFTACADANIALGRFNQEALTDQMQMELLVEGLTDAAKRKYKDASGAFLEIAQWESVELEGDNVIGLGFDFYCEGSLALQFIPPTTRRFHLSDAKVSGTIDTAALPGGIDEFTFTDAFGMSGTIDFCTLPSQLAEFDISENGFSGSVDLTALPPYVREMNISANNFTGSVVLGELPLGLQRLFLGANSFEGSLALDDLPATLEHLELNDCNFSGSLDLSHLSEYLEILRVDGNALSGEFRLPKHMECLQALNASTNEFSGVAVVHSGHRDHVTLYANKIAGVVDEKGEQYMCRMDEFGGFVEEITP